MAELTISQLIKLILGIAVFVAVVGGLYFFFKGSVMDFFSFSNDTLGGKFFLGLLK